MNNLNKRIYELLNPGKSWEEIKKEGYFEACQKCHILFTAENYSKLNNHKCSAKDGIIRHEYKPLELADVLRALGKQSEYVRYLISCKGYIGTVLDMIDFPEVNCVKWDLKKDLDHQSKEVRNSLAKLLE